MTSNKYKFFARLQRHSGTDYEMGSSAASVCQELNPGGPRESNDLLFQWHYAEISQHSAPHNGYPIGGYV